jgi:hypothetical protein
MSRARVRDLDRSQFVDLLVSCLASMGEAPQIRQGNPNSLFVLLGLVREPEVTGDLVPVLGPQWPFSGRRLEKTRQEPPLRASEQPRPERAFVDPPDIVRQHLGLHWNCL